jgi:hypothetical protein
MTKASRLSGMPLPRTSHIIEKHLCVSLASLRLCVRILAYFTSIIFLLMCVLPEVRE